jgi:hypothetical protein
MHEKTNARTHTRRMKKNSKDENCYCFNTYKTYIYIYIYIYIHIMMCVQHIHKEREERSYWATWARWRVAFHWPLFLRKKSHGMVVSNVVSTRARARYNSLLKKKQSRDRTEIPTIIDPVALGYFLVAQWSIIVGISAASNVIIHWCTCAIQSLFKETVTGP